MDAEYKYFAFMDAKDAFHKKYHVGDRECFMLRVISKAYLSGEKMRVSDVINLKDFSSPATLHGILKELIKKKNISITIDPADGRVKYVEPTQITFKMYKEMTKNFIQVANSK